jgi:low affinity Fe/Cu permease
MAKRSDMDVKGRTSWFTRFTKHSARIAGRPLAFAAAVTVVALWAVGGFVFGFSDTWQLIINTGTTIITFLMVFLIQATQNRDSEALHLKIDELIRATPGAHVALLDLEELDEDDLREICDEYQELAKRARKALDEGKSDTNVPRIRPHAARK